MRSRGKGEYLQQLYNSDNFEYIIVEDIADVSLIYVEPFTRREHITDIVGTGASSKQFWMSMRSYILLSSVPALKTQRSRADCL